MGNLSSYFLKPRNHGTVLPEEIILSEILTKLPVKSLIRFKCVSKKWFGEITNHSSFKEVCLCNQSDSGIIILAKDFDMIKYRMFFIHKDDDDDDDDKKSKVAEIEISYLFERGVRKSDDINILGSSNGLVLLSSTCPSFEPNLILWNPVTRESRNIPKPIVSTLGFEFDILQEPILGLGFDESDNNHKIIRVSQKSSFQSEGDFPMITTALNLQVFSKKSDLWRKLKPVPGYQLWNLDAGPGVSLSGAFYFLAVQVRARRTCILSFDFRDEEVRHIVDVPAHLSGSDLAIWKEQSIALIAFKEHPMEATGNFEFWVMMHDHDHDHDHDHKKEYYYWAKLFKLDDPNYFTVRDTSCGVWRDQFLVVQFHRQGTELRLWDPFRDGKRRRVFKLAKVGPHWFFSLGHSFVPSLVSVYPDDHRLSYTWNL